MRSLTTRVLAFLLALVLLGVPASYASAAASLGGADGAGTTVTAPRPAPPVTPAPSFTPPPARHKLQTVSYEPQRMNNCGPITINMVLGHFGIGLSQEYTAMKIRPNPDDVSVDDIEMVTFAKIEYGYQGEVKWGGNMRLLEALIANGIPVIVLQLLDPTSDIDHFRVVQGYDRVRRVVTVSDSYRGKDLEWSYEYFEGLWDRSPREYAIAYPPSKAAVVKAITQRYGTDDRSVERELLAELRAYVQSSPTDPWGWLRLGHMAYHWEHYEEALQAWDRARALGLPQKALWYGVWPIALLNQVGRHHEALELASGVIENRPASSEAYFERARAYEALGQPSLAWDDLRLGLDSAPYNPHLRAAYKQHLRDN